MSVIPTTPSPIQSGLDTYNALFQADAAVGGIVLGPVTFALAEHPNELSIGGSSALVVHDYAGGGRAIEGFGPREHDITWSGMLRDSNALARNALLEQMRIAGNQVYFAFNYWTYLVIVKEYTIKFINEWRLDYSITLEVMRNLSQQAQQSVSSNQDTQNASLFASASLQFSQIVSVDPTNPSNTSTETPAEAASGTPSTTEPFGDAFNALATPTQNLQSALSNSFPIASNPSQQNTVLQAAQTAVVAAQSYLAGIASPTNGQVALIGGYINALSVLMKNTQQPITPISITVNGASLEELASQYYGDPTLSSVLKQANGLVSNFVPAGVLTKLVIPAISSVTAAT